MKSPINLLAALSILFFAQCSKDDNSNFLPAPCTDEILGDFFLDPTALDFIPYQQPKDLRFRDSLNNKLVLQFDKFNEQELRELYIEMPCELDSSQIIKRIANQENINYFLKDPTNKFPYTFSVALRVNLNFYTDSAFYNDYLYVTAFSPDRRVPQKYLLFLRLNSGNYNSSIPPFTLKNPIPAVILLGTTFENVYTSGDVGIYYTLNEGLVAFTDEDQKLWVLDR